MPTLSTPELFIFSGSEAAMESFFCTSMASAVPDAEPVAAGSLLLTQPESESAVAMVRTGRRYRVRMASLAVQGFSRLPQRCGRELHDCLFKPQEFVFSDALVSSISPEGRISRSICPP